MKTYMFIGSASFSADPRGWRRGCLDPRSPQALMVDAGDVWNLSLPKVIKLKKFQVIKNKIPSIK